ncbi:Putative redox-active protein (C_GCAxxG_C_C) [Humidesulfovibrio mexicanus]|uniref:Putative redox-active protein (C_GCAxxG_C_C) n=1 Tax=Humidesulfovibrio mexicanus TaxID=147047 RepID=A0A238YFS2_9BACT|nr:DV_1555 family C-GCAxxG-C-C protein [Humidesulfovibrio mexicanus]SNR69454.1 Putative redox-active protein (C_GCAxxG_C_C) [Humidesulfovibrio mexicanus]
MDETLMDILPLAGQGFCCSQIMGLLALRAQGRENPELIRALGGLCNGLGACSGSGCGACGIVTGGACVLGLYFGKGRAEEFPLERADLARAEFVDWFVERTRGEYGGSACADILGDDSGRPDMARCGALLAESWARIVGILAGHGLDVAEGRDA